MQTHSHASSESRTHPKAKGPSSLPLCTSALNTGSPKVLRGGGEPTVPPLGTNFYRCNNQNSSLLTPTKPPSSPPPKHTHIPLEGPRKQRTLGGAHLTC